MFSSPGSFKSQNMKSLLFLSLFFPLITSKNTCHFSICNSSNFITKFPFGTQNQNPENCIFPGFKLSCTKHGLTSLNLPQSGDFLVRYINYRTQEILIHDSESCLAKRFFNFTLTNSPFMSPYYANFTFINCPTRVVRSSYKVIDCLSDSESTTLAAISWNMATHNSCEVIGTFMLPVSRPGPYDDDMVSFVLKDDILLTWDSPDCMGCEASGAKCGIIDNSNRVGCFNDLGKGRNKALHVLKIISFTLAVPGGGCLLILALVVCHVTSCQRPRAPSFTAQEIALPPQPDDTIVITGFITSGQQPRAPGFTAQEIALPPQPDDTIVITGLDESTIESYTKVILGESKRLPGPSDGTCAICLSEFCVQDMIRVIPECRHCFHATCIDEWLRMRSTCPLCRNSTLLPHENIEQG